MAIVKDIIAKILKILIHKIHIYLCYVKLYIYQVHVQRVGLVRILRIRFMFIFWYGMIDYMDGNLIECSKRGMSNKDMAVIVGVGISKLLYWKRRMRSYGISFPSKSGRPPKSNAFEKFIS